MNAAAAESLAAIVRAIYEPWRQRHASAKGLLDRDRRCPERLIEIAKQRGWMPNAARTICVTGSKGKGSVVRLIAFALQQQGYRVGMVLSPHERDHQDRIRINNSPIPLEALQRSHTLLAEPLSVLLHNYPPPFYPAPSGLFLLHALAWFAESEVDFCVLEAGRGGASDELGQVPNRISVVTSVFAEHESVLGPSLREIGVEKLGIGRSAETLVVSDQLSEFVALCPHPDLVVVPASTHSFDEDAQQLANAVLQSIRCEPNADRKQLASIKTISTPGGTIHLLPWIHPASIREDELLAGQPIVLGISDDKSPELADALLAHGSCHALSIDGSKPPSGYLGLGAVNLQSDGLDLRHSLEPLVAAHGDVHLVGNQQLMALARRAWQVPQVGPGA